jgi:hypothetical protein
MEHLTAERRSEIVRKILEEKTYINETKLKPLWKINK